MTADKPNIVPVSIREPKTIKYAEAFYLELKGENTVPFIWEGNIGRVYDSLKISKTYYGKIRKLLLETGAIEIVTQGYRGQLSVINVFDIPSSEVLVNEYKKMLEQALTTPDRYATLRVRLDEVERELKHLKAWRASFRDLSVFDAIQNMEARIEALEGTSPQNT